MIRIIKLLVAVIGLFMSYAINAQGINVKSFTLQREPMTLMVNSAHWCLVNVKTGQKVFDPYDNMDIRPYNEAPSPVNDRKYLILECTGGRWYLFNSEGELTELPKNDESFHYRYFERGYAILKREGKYGFVDSKAR